MVFALYANGMIGGDDLTKEIQTITDHFNDARRELLGQTSEVVEEFEDVMEAPLFKGMQDG